MNPLAYLWRWAAVRRREWVFTSTPRIWVPIPDTRTRPEHNAFEGIDRSVAPQSLLAEPPLFYTTDPHACGVADLETTMRSLAACMARYR